MVKKSRSISLEVDRSDARPLYLQLKDRLVADFHDPKRTGGEIGLSDAELMTRFGVSRPTVRNAVAELVRSGLITRVPGRGTFFTPREKLAVGVDRLDRFFAEWHLSELDAGTQILAFRTVKAPPDVAARLRIDRSDMVLMMRRLRTAAGEPATLDVRYVVGWCAKHIRRADAEKDLLFNILDKRASIPATAVEQEIGVETATLAEAKPLKIAVGAPLLSRAVTIFTTGDIPIITGNGWYRSDRFRFRTRAERGDDDAARRS